MIVLEATFEKSAARLEDAPEGDLPEVCFVGRSNVGKSSALNLLTRRRHLARVSRTPGRTRLLNFFRVELASKAGPNRRTATLRLCDLPGYGYAEAPKAERKTWGAMIGGYLDRRTSLAAVVMLVDCEIGPQPKDHEMLGFLADLKPPLLVAATKSDRVARTRLGGQLDRISRELQVPRASVLPFSAETGAGRDEMWNALCAAAGLLGRRDGGLLVESAPDELEGPAEGEP